MKKVAILGSGPAGLVSAKVAIDCGFKTVVFEKNDELGGIWNSKTGKVWDSMYANTSRATFMGFSDFPWPNGVPIFPHHEDVFNYLYSYAKSFDLIKNIRFNSEVKNIKKQGKKWQVSWHEEQDTLLDKTELFDFVIVATGFISEPVFPKINGIENFKKNIIHSIYYKSNEDYKDKDVAVIGMSFSGTEIACDLSKSAKSVLHIIRRPYWVLPKFIFDPEKNRTVPWDWKFLVRSSRLYQTDEEIKFFKPEDNFKLNCFFEFACEKLTSVHPLNIDKDKYSSPPFYTISNDYMDIVKSGKIEVKNSNIAKIDRNIIYFDDGNSKKFDKIVLATGYKTNLKFLDKSILETLEHDESDSFLPILLYKSTFHPDLLGMAFVGITKVSAFLVMEMQARWICHVFRKKIKLPKADIMKNGIEESRFIRTMEDKQQLLHADFVGLSDSIAKETQSVPDLNKIKGTNPHFYHLLWNEPIIPFHYRLNGLSADEEYAKKQIFNAYEFMSNYKHKK